MNKISFFKSGAIFILGATIGAVGIVAFALYLSEPEAEPTFNQPRTKILTDSSDLEDYRGGEIE